MKNYGNLLKKERESRNISQDYLSKNIGISQAQISYYEHNINIPGIDIIEKIADFYGISIDDLVGHEIKKNWID